MSNEDLLGKALIDTVTGNLIKVISSVNRNQVLTDSGLRYRNQLRPETPEEMMDKVFPLSDYLTLI